MTAVAVQMPAAIDGVSAAAGATMSSLVIISLIVLGSAVAAVTLLRTWRSVQNDLRLISTNKRRIEQAADNSALAEIVRALPAGSHLGRRLDVCVDLDRVGAEPDIAALRALTEDALERSLRAPRWVAANVVLLGLMGTVIGLIVAVSQGAVVASSPADATVPAALRLLDSIFGGLRTAFSTTLAGIMSAVSLGGAISLVRGRQLKMREELERLSLTTLFPRLKTSPEQALAQASRSLAFIQKRLEDVLTQILAGVRDHSDKTLTRLDTHAALVTETLAASAKTFSSQMSTSASTFVERTAAASDALVSFMGDTSTPRVSIVDLNRSVEESSAQLARSANALASAAPAVGEQVARQVDAQTRDLAEVIAQVAKQAQTTLQDHARDSVSVVRQMVKDESEARSRDVAALLTSHSEHEQRIGTSLSQLVEVAAALESATAALKQRSESESQPSAAVATALRELHRTQELALQVLQDLHLQNTMRQASAAATEAPARGRGLFSLFGQR